MNFAFISQFVEIPDDVVFTVEYSVRAAQMAVYELLGVDRKVPPVTRRDKSLRTQLEALIKTERLRESACSRSRCNVFRDLVRT